MEILQNLCSNFVFSFLWCHIICFCIYMLSRLIYTKLSVLFVFCLLFKFVINWHKIRGEFGCEWAAITWISFQRIQIYIFRFFVAYFWVYSIKQPLIGRSYLSSQWSIPNVRTTSSSVGWTSIVSSTSSMNPHLWWWSVTTGPQNNYWGPSLARRLLSIQPSYIYNELMLWDFQEDEHLLASDASLDSKLTLFRSVRDTSENLLACVENYQAFLLGKIW